MAAQSRTLSTAPGLMRALAQLALGAAGACLALVLVGLLLLQLAPVQNAILEFALGRINSGDMHIEVGDIGGTWPAHLVLDKISIADADGIWLSLDHAEMEWRPSALLLGQAHVVRLLANGLDVARSPRSSKPDTGGGFSIPRLPVAVAVDEMNVTGLTLGRALVEPGAKGLLATLDLQARTKVTAKRLDMELTGARTDGTAGRLDARALFDQRDKRLSLSISGEDGAVGKPGLAAGLGGLQLDRVAFDIKAEGLNGTVDGTAKIDGGKEIALDGTLSGKWDRALDLDFTLKASGDFPRRELAALGGGHGMDAAGKLLWGPDDTIALKDLTVNAGALALKGDGSLGTASVVAPHEMHAQGTLAGADRLIAPKGNVALALLDWKIDGTLDNAGGMARISEALVSSASAQARFSGDVRLDGTALKGAADIVMTDVAPLGELIGRPIKGAAEVHFAPFALEPSGDMTGDFVVRGKDLDIGDPILNRILGEFTADGSVLLPKNGNFALPSLIVTPASGFYTFRATLARSKGDALTGEAKFAAGNVANLLPDGQAAGKLTATAVFSGTTAAPDATLKVALENGRIGGLDARLVTLDAAAQMDGAARPVALRFDGPRGKAKIDASLTLPKAGGARLDAINADLFGARLAGDVVVAPDALVTASLKGDRVTLKPLAEIAGVPIEGTAAIALNAAPVRGQQNATLSVTSERLSTNLMTRVDLNRVKLDVALADLIGKPQIDATFSAASGQAGITRLSNVAASAKGPLDKLSLSARVAGKRESFKPQPLTLAGDALLSGDALTISQFKLALGDASMALAKPQRIALAKEIGAKGMAIEMRGPSGTGQLNGDFSLGASARLQLHGTGLPLDLAPLFMPVDTVRGTASTNVNLDTARGTGTFDISFAKVRIAQDADDERPPFDVTMQGKWAKGRLDAKAEAQSTSREPFQLTASLPVIRDAQGAWPMLAASGPVTGQLLFDGEITSLMAFVDMPGSRLTGDTRVALDVSGDIAAPQVSGAATISNGTYENFDSGTVIRNISARLEGSRNQSLNFSLDGTDGAKGRVKAQGVVALAKGAFPTISINANFANARLVHLPEVDLAVDGDLELLGPSFPPSQDALLTLKGALSTRSLQVRIPERLPSSVATIDVIEINGDPSKQAAPTSAPTLPLVLDLTVKVDQPAHISGRGLDSFWVGGVAVMGTLNRPQVRGELKSQRGTFDFAGKTFALSKGSVRFPGRYPIDPDLDVELTYQRADLKALVDVSGRSTSPKIALSSTPALPRDEILSRILFGKGVGQLTAIEAVQLANTLAELSGGGIGSGGVLNRLQQSLSLDVLRIDSGKSGATTVSAGKYIQKDVYVGVEQGALASDSSVKVEIQVTPQISVNTSVGQNASGKVGANWKWDY